MGSNYRIWSILVQLSEISEGTSQAYSYNGIFLLGHGQGRYISSLAWPHALLMTGINENCIKTIECGIHENISMVARRVTSGIPGVHVLRAPSILKC